MSHGLFFTEPSAGQGSELALGKLLLREAEKREGDLLRMEGIREGSSLWRVASGLGC